MSGSAATLDVAALRRRRVAELLPPALRAAEVDLYLVLTRETARDPFAEEVGLGQAVARAAGLFHLATGGLRARAIVASYDTSPVEESGIYDEVTAYAAEGLRPHLAEAVTSLQPRRVAINSSRDLPMGDGLTLGMLRYLEEALGDTMTAELVSAEDIVVSLLSRKFPEEVQRIEHAVVATQEILQAVLTAEHVRPGVTTERDLGDTLEQLTVARGLEVVFTTVVVGPCRGHASPSDRVIEPGDLIRVDFGVRHDGYCSDIQRTAYVLRPGEIGAPAPVTRLFQVTLAANRAAVGALQPGSTGLAVDTAARLLIEAEGFDGYPHAAGHGLGRRVHDVGPALGPDWPERYGDRVRAVLEPGQVFAVEPMVYAALAPGEAPVNIGLEEDVVIEPDGPRVLGRPQQELILIG
jgi:Xaa-Pro aminopeptidase